jgi:hypothetical protein
MPSPSRSRKTVRIIGKSRFFFFMNQAYSKFTGER